MEASEIICLDVGLKHTGIARASSFAKLPQSLATVDTDKLVAWLMETVKSKDIKAIVVGLPRGLQGQETDQTKWVRQWAVGAKKTIKAPFYWQDEALTSVGAAKNPGSDEHSAAAQIILQDFLNTPEDKRVRA